MKLGGDCSSANPHLLRGRWSSKLASWFKITFPQKAPRAGPTLCHSPQREKEYGKTKEKMLWKIPLD